MFTHLFFGSVFLYTTFLVFMDMKKPWNAITAIPTLASLMLVLLDYLFSLNETEKLLIYIFDLFVVMLLVRDFYSRSKSLTTG